MEDDYTYDNEFQLPPDKTDLPTVESTLIEQGFNVGDGENEIPPGTLLAEIFQRMEAAYQGHWWIDNITSVTIKDDEPKEISCPICLNGFRRGEMKTIVKCEHEFHNKCLLSWLDAQNAYGTERSCPLCRFPLEKEIKDEKNQIQQLDFAKEA